MNDQQPVANQRARLTVRLRGGATEDGKIPLDDIAQIAQQTQELVRRVARGLTGRSGPGRSPKDLERLTDLLLVGLHPGSTVIEIEAPAAQTELELPDLLPDVGVLAVEALMDGLGAAVRNEPLPALFSGPAIGGLRQWLASLENYSEVCIEAQAQRDHSVSFAPAEAQQSLPEGSPDFEDRSRTEERSIEGLLYAVNLHTHTHSIEDDAGRTIRCTLSDEPENIGHLLGRRVHAVGVASVDEIGRIEHFAVRAVQLAEAPSGLDRDRFFQATDIEQLIAASPPAADLAALEIEELTEDESEAFLSALSNSDG